MLVADAVRAVAICAVPVVSATGNLSIGLLYAVLAVQATGQVVFDSAVAPAVVALVDGDMLGVANGRLATSQAGSGLVGAGLAGLLLGVVAVPDALWVDGASFAVSALNLAALRVPFQRTDPVGLGGGGLRRAIRDLLVDTRAGIAYMWRHPVLRKQSIQVGAVNLFGSAATSQVVLIATRRLGASNSKVGYLEAASSLGVVALSVVIGPLCRRLAVRVSVTASLVAYGSSILTLGLTRSYAVGLGCAAVMGAATVVYNVSTNTFRQQAVPDELLGRAQNIAIVFAWCAIPVGSLASGLIIASTGRPGTVFAAVGAGIAVIGLAGSRFLRPPPRPED